MIGRLLGKAPHQHVYANSYEDNYTRTILYGTQKQFEPVQFNKSQIRIVLSKDVNIRSKKVLYDSNTMIKDSSVNYKVQEINNYMFGSGLPTNDYHDATKLHFLPIINVPFILITRIFLIPNSEPNFQDTSSECSGEEESNWTPVASIPQKCSSYDTSTRHTKFALGIVVPNYPNILNYWSEISRFISEIQLDVATVIKDKSSATQALDLEKIFSKSIHTLFNLIVNLDLPRLINGLIYTNTTHKHANESVYMCWVSEILNWLTYKETAIYGTFLANLFSIIIPRRNELGNHIVDFSQKNEKVVKKKKLIRVVIMTCNPSVAKKLVFIINGLIPDSLNVKFFVGNDNNNSNSNQLNNDDSLSTTIDDLSSSFNTSSINENEDFTLHSTNFNINSNASLQNNMGYDNISEIDRTAPILTSSENQNPIPWEIPKSKILTSRTPTSIPGLIQPSTSSVSYLSSSVSHSSLNSLGSWKFLDMWKPEEIEPSTPKTSEAVKVLPLIDIPRTRTSVGFTTNTHDRIKEIMECEPVFHLSSEFLIVDTSITYKKPIKEKVLPPSIPYTPTYNPIYTMQTCTPNMNMNNLILDSMKKDFELYKDCGMDVFCESVVVSLRERVVWLLTVGEDENNNSYMSDDDTKSINGSTLTAVDGIGNSFKNSFNFTTSAFGDGFGLNTGPKTTIKKLYTPSKSLVPTPKFSRIDGLFGIIGEKFHMVESGTVSFEKSGMLDLIYSLVEY